MESCTVSQDSGLAYIHVDAAGEMVTKYKSVIAQLESRVSDIDPIQYGALTAQVSKLDEEVQELRADVKSLLELANKSRGGFWAGMAIASSFGGFVGFFTDHLMRR